MGRAFRRGAGVIALLAGVVGVSSAAACALDVDSNLAIAAAAMFPLVVAVVFVVGVIAAIAGRWLATGVSVIVVVSAVGMLSPLYISDADDNPDSTRGSHSVRLLQANLAVGAAQPGPLVEMVRNRQIDLLTVEELTGDSVQALRGAGLEDVLPYQFLAPLSGANGTGIYSRFPLSDERELDGYLMSNLQVSVDVNLTHPVRLYAVHPAPPYLSPAPLWTRELTRLREELRSASTQENVIASGDFNATYYQRQFRDLLTGGYTDAVEYVGEGLTLTYPTDKWFPPIVGIDHVLTKGAWATSIESVQVIGSDHRGLIADVQLDESGRP